NELAEAIVESVLGCGELDSELDDLELACLDSDMEEIILKEFFQEHQSRQLSIEGLSYNSKSPGDGSIDEIDYIQEYPSAKCNNFSEKLEYHQRSSRQREQDSQRFARLEQFMNDDIFTYPMYSVQDKLPVLEKALLKHRAVKANYYSIARETVDAIRLNPLVLLQEDGMWLVVAYCHEKDDIFVFRVDRMKDVFETNHTFETPQNINELRCKMLAAYK
ncbi:MAG: WYL domain-containing protein, partial [Cyanobacteria bacterium]|nr:WYL domain-containing protein [Cyanobacteriota bacterium]